MFFRMNSAKSLAIADEVVIANVFKSESIPEAERLDVSAVAAQLGQHRPSRPRARRRGKHRATVRSRNALRRRRCHSLQRRLWRHLRKTSTAVEVSALQIALRQEVSGELPSQPRCCFSLFFCVSSVSLKLPHATSFLSPIPNAISSRSRLKSLPAAIAHELQLPVWNALYQVRDFSQNMNWIRATSSAIRSAADRHPTEPQPVENHRRRQAELASNTKCSATALVLSAHN